jgi:hypothetical protein
MKNIKYDIERLNNVLKRDNAILIGEYIKLTNITEITFECKCGEIYTKLFRVLVRRCGAFCKACSKTICDLRRRNTSRERFGVDYPAQNVDVKDKLIETNLNRYGVSSPLHSEKLKTKIEETLLSRYGVRFPSQSLEIQIKIQKESKKFKTFTFPSGIIRNVQGYEPYALRDLLKSYNEDEIVTDRKNVPRVLYIKDNIPHYYFPDIFIPKDNKIIEVKSLWTYKNVPYNIDLKQEACKNIGFMYEIWCYNKNGDRININ